MEELKRTDPKRYEEMQARRQEFRTRMAEALATRDDFLGSIDLSLLTEEQRETHRRFTEALAAQQEAMARMDAAMESGVEPTEEERQQMREAFRNVRDLQNAERDALLGAVATSMGLQAGEEADSFVEVVKSVYFGYVYFFGAVQVKQPAVLLVAGHMHGDFVLFGMCFKRGVQALFVLFHRGLLSLLWCRRSLLLCLARQALWHWSL